MIKTLEDYINNGKIQLFCVDGIDKESWFNHNAHPSYRAKRVNDYEYCINNDIVHFIKTKNTSKKIMLTGASFGAYYTVNFFLKHPELYDIGIAQFGCYCLKFNNGDFINNDIYFNIPLMYMAGE